MMGQVPLSSLVGQTPVPVGGAEDLFWRLGNTLGAIGILAWYFYQTQTKTIPEKDRQIAAERIATDTKIQATLEASKLEMQRDREAHAVAVSTLVSSHQDTVEKLVDELRAEREARMAIIESCKVQRFHDHGEK
jgi:F0F1-type ATP synthase membrane subunit b/b'